MQKITADSIHLVSQSPVTQTVLVLDDQGTILSIDPIDQHDPASVRHIQGTIIPGFVNCHCHLELSHLKARVDTGTGLLPFLQEVVHFREEPDEVIQEAIRQADQEMWEGGIVAVGDISNKADTFATKSSSPIQYYTFLEMFDFLQDQMADTFFEQYKAVYDDHPGGSAGPVRAVPHAPYTVSNSLYAKLQSLNPDGGTISIHNQETTHENELFLTGGGGFPGFMESFGFSMDHFKPNGKTSIHHALAHLETKAKLLLVHNTLSTQEDIQAVKEWGGQAYWVTCPNANLYIENRLPLYQHFLDQEVKVTVGTDSLTSNWQLSILEELRTISKFQSYVPTETLIRWATLNGALALGFDDSLGSIEVGKRPGLNVLNLNSEGRIDAQTIVQKLV